MGAKRLSRFNDGLEWGMFGLAALCLVYYSFEQEWAKILEAVLILAVLLGIRLVVKVTKAVLFPLLRLSILLFITLTMFIANMFGMYGVIPHLDDVEHLASGIILGFVGLLVFRQVSKEASPLNGRFGLLPVWFSWFFAIAMAGFWEIYEFTTDALLGMNSQGGGLDDTMIDMICGSIGASIAAVYLRTQAKRDKLPPRS
ncbi:hypothetical protein [Paenibacillus koleovorans]|uniref:hypothetical protein n=1 Tax=Paenibacillus koleovorans TaxID=121608 RepID=UPI000FD82DD2|nr:hypothetical protein [Paenibacillus koleovorans]